MNFKDKHLSRKAKKRLLGKILNKSKLRKKIAKIKIIKHPYPITSEIVPEAFCPICGCKETDYHEETNSEDSRDIWMRGYCLRCDFLVFELDNSPGCHCLEFIDFKIEI